MSEMSWCNLLRRAVSDYCGNDNFPGTFADFHLKIFTQDIYSNAVVKVPCNCCGRTLNIAVIK